VARLPIAGDWLQTRWLASAADGSEFVKLVKPLAEPARQWALAGAKSLGEGVVTLFLSALIVFFLWRDGDALSARLRRLAQRVAGERALQLAEVAQNTVRGTVYGILGTALAQAILALIGFALAGVPGAFLLGVGTFFLSVVPMGPPFIWGPAAFWLYQQGETGWAIFLVIWGAAVISSVDNFLKPMLISRGSKLPFILVLLGVLGGVVAFGFVGIFLGPTLLAVAYRLLDEWTAAPENKVVIATAASPGDRPAA
jgi:predicted PurR-regulated permease PerM